MPATPTPLPENTGLAFLGETPWTPARLTARQAGTLAATRNPAGRPNRDVLRSFVGASGRQWPEHWQIDFPAHYTAQEAALHARPFALLKKTLGPTAAQWWVNPHAQPPLRHALARVDRFLATALAAPHPAWRWIEGDHLPDATLLVIARDDDFTHAVLASAAFTAWWRAHAAALPPVRIIASFPFPWPPFTPLGSLSKIQQECRSHAMRAMLSGEPASINSAIAAAYGWPGHPDAEEILTRLHSQHARERLRK